jgi:CheY-like chemotaxis protein
MNTMSTAESSPELEQHGAHTVLIVEDEMMVRMPIAEYLRDCGYHVVEAGDASEAIAAMHADDGVSLVFSDVRMPGNMDGFALEAWFRAHYPNVPVLLTSGYHGGRSLSTVSIPGTRFIAKPYSQAQVARRIAALLSS